MSYAPPKSLEDVVHSPLELLACMARADGDIEIEEALAIRGFLETAGAPQNVLNRVSVLLDPKQPGDFEHIVADFAKHASPWMLAAVIRDAYVVAGVDGEVGVAERQMLDGLFDRMGIEVEQRTSLHEWARKAASLQLEGVGLCAHVLGE